MLIAAHCAYGPNEHPVRLAAAVGALTDLELDPAGAGHVGSQLNTMLHEAVVSLYANGWQPADVAHTVKRHWTVRAQRLVIAVIAGEARSCDAMLRAPEAWLAQLVDLGVYDSARGAIVGGHHPAFAGWARAERLDPDEWVTIGVQVLGQLLMSPRQAVLIDPPSSWSASNRGTVPSAARGDVDAKVLKVVRALLNQAERTDFEAEAEAFTAKAQEMMTRYSIDAAVLASSACHTGLGTGVESRRVHIDSPYADEKAQFLAVIAAVNSARSVWSPSVGFSTVVGFPVDLHLTDLLFTSLLVQATRASADATATNPNRRTASFRRAFLIAFAHRIGERLEATKQRACVDAEHEYGSALVPILADREAAVTDAFDRAFPETTAMRSRRVNADGWHAGTAAADRAQIGAGPAVTAG